MPPPNITGQLHMGHALFATLQDILIRFRRMQGYDALWIPGTDHAGLATQTKLEEELTNQGISNPTREQFDKIATEWKSNMRNRITTQLRCLGASCDWERETFTLDDDYTKAVHAAFQKCKDAGMLYSEDGQLYLNMENLAQDILERHSNGEIKIIPEGGDKTFRHFLENIEPWCISRQIWWGHQIPGEKDVFDTWFSSALWPFAILGWPEETEDYKRYYPATLIETADDIIFFWCARMLMMGLFLTDKLPFNTIYLHGIIRDEYGRKMAKSLDNGIDPLEIIDEYGCDAMRFALAENTIAGQDMNLGSNKFESGKRIANKLWQASRFTLSHIAREGLSQRNLKLDGTDALILEELEEARKLITKHLDEFRFDLAAYELRKFFWHRYCDFYIEDAKERLYSGDKQALMTNELLLEGLLKLFHPFMPYMTEHIWQKWHNTSLIIADW